MGARQTKSVMIIGGSGFLGTHLAQTLRDEGYKVFATYHNHSMNIPGVTCLPLSVDSRSWIKKIIYSMRPDVVIYMAGSNSNEQIVRNPRRAELLHSTGPATIASASDIMQPRFIYLSNPYVFDGMRGNYHEGDTVLPSTPLGKLKLSGENIVRSRMLNYVILRSSPIIGRGNGLNFSFIDRLRMNLDREQRIEASPYEIHSFAPVEGLCNLVRRLIDSGVRNRILHYGGLTKMTTYEFAQAFAKHFNYNPKLIIPSVIKQKKSSYAEDHVHDFSLNSTQSIETLKIKSFLLEESFNLIQKKLIPDF